MQTPYNTFYQLPSGCNASFHPNVNATTSLNNTLTDLKKSFQTLISKLDTDEHKSELSVSTDIVKHFVNAMCEFDIPVEKINFSIVNKFDDEIKVSSKAEGEVMISGYNEDNGDDNNNFEKNRRFTVGGCEFSFHYSSVAGKNPIEGNLEMKVSLLGISDDIRNLINYIGNLLTNLLKLSKS